MYRVMIVDDEPLVRQGIINSVNWDNHGVEQILEAGDGVRAMELYREERVDIVITDIRMPRMDGIKLIKSLKEEKREPILIVLSGYSDFAYLQEAIRQEVTDYLLKPLDPEELNQVIGTAISRIRMNRQGKALARDGINLLRENTFMRMMEGNIGKNELKEKLKHLQIEFHKGNYRISVFQLHLDEKIPKEDLSLMTYACGNVSNELMQEHTYGISFSYEEGNVILLYDQGDDLEEIEAFQKELQRILEEVLGIQGSYGTGKVVEELEEIAYSYATACAALTQIDTAREKKEYSKLVEELLSYIDAHFTENLSLKEIADRLYVNPSYLGYIFKKEYGISFLEYVNRQKVGYGKKLLKTTNLKIYEIAAMVGFQDTRYFVKIFKKYEGTVPSDIRR